MSLPLDSAARAAIVLLALGEVLAGDLLARLPPDEARRIVQALGRLGRVAPETVDTALRAFSEQMRSATSRSGSGLVGDAAAARRLLRSTGAAQTRADAERPDSDWLDDPGAPLAATIARFDATPLAAVLRAEHPQTAALVLAYAAPKLGGETLKLLAAPLRLELVVRIARLEAVDAGTLAEVEAALRDTWERTGRVQRDKRGGAAAVAALLNGMDKAAADAQLASLAARAPELAAEVEALLFTFDDLIAVDDRGLQTLLAQVTDAQLIPALKAAAEPVRRRFLANVSARKAAQLQDDIEALAKLRRSDAEAAQRTIAALARRLLDEGRIQLSA